MTNACVGKGGTVYERIEFEGLCNTRDMGGIPVDNARFVAPHRLLRSGALTDASDNDLVRLSREFDVRTIIDFRTPEEASQKPDPTIADAAHVSLPALQSSALGITHEDGAAVMNLANELETLASNTFNPRDYMCALYRNIALQDNSIAQYRRFFDVLLQQDAGAVLWHCSMGKDRAGIAAALALLALGAQPSVVADDYLATNTCVKDINERDAERYSAMAPNHLRSVLKDKFMQLFEARHAYLECTFDAMRQRAGSLDAYLDRELGVDDDARIRLTELYTR